jgi:ABC-type Fe3+ transport system substrate-binding protein
VIRIPSTARTLCVAVLALATGGAAASAEDWQAGAGPEWAKVLTAAKAEGKVTVAGHSALGDPFAAAFKRDTGITLEWLGGSPNELTQRLVREATANNLTIDVALGGGTELSLLYPKGGLAPIKPQLMLPGVKDGPQWVSGKTMWMDDEGQYFFRGSLYVVGWPLINTTVVKPESITSWKDFLKPEFKGKIAAYDPRSGGPGQGVAGYVAEVFGIPFLQQLYIGQEARYTREDQQLVEWVARGVHPVGFATIQSVVEKFRALNLPIQAIAPKDGPGYLSSGFSVLKQAKGAPRPNAATVFINWYASKPGQEVYTRVMLEASTRTDVDVKELPDYVKPKKGIDYLDTYNGNWYVKNRPEVAKAVLDALGGR